MKTRITTYTFDASAKTITFSSPLDIEGFQLITNVVDNIVIYNFADPTKGGTFTTNTLTLAYNTTSMSDTDELMILYEDGINTVAVTDNGGSITVDGTVTANTGLSQPLTDTQLRATAVPVSLSSVPSHNVTNAGTFAVQSTNQANSGVDIGDVTINNASGANAVNIQDGGNTITVDGTVTANTGLSQPLTDTQLRATAVPVSLASVPSHAVTNAGTFPVQATLAAETTKVIGTVNVAAAQTIAVTQSGTWDEVGINDSGNSITVDNAALSAVGGGTEATAQRVTIASDSTGVLSVDDNGEALTVDGAVTVTNATAANLKAEVVGTGTFATQATLAAETTKVIGTVRVASGGIASGALASGSIATGAIVDAKADDSAFTPATSRVFPIGAMADETSTDSVDEGDVGVPRMTLDRKQIVSVYPSATGEGLGIFRSIDLDETEEDVKTTAGKLFGWFIHNKNAATLYLKFYNATAANTTVGTTTPILTIPVPSGASANVEYTNGIAFSTALSAAVTTGVADNDTGAPGTNDFIANIFYK